jgi:SNF2 family DNA or RNA helicase
MADFDNKIDNCLRLFQKYLNNTNLQHKDYQYDGVKWCLINELRENPPNGVRGGFIADEMGLGKTIMMIGTFYSNFMLRTLVIVPPILMDQWFAQIYKTTGHKAIIYHGDKKKKITFDDLNKACIVISTYGAITLTKNQIAQCDISLLHKVKWGRIVFDEAHHLRNCKTTRFTGAKMLNANIRWLVSGTPVQNRKNDFYSLCSMLRLPANYYTDAANLRDLTNNFLIKRTKKQVGIQMPDIIQDKNIVNWKNSREKNMSAFIHSALNFSRIAPIQNNIMDDIGANSKLILMLRAKQSCIYPKLISKHFNNLVTEGLIQNHSYYKDAFNYSSKLDFVLKTILERKDNGCGKLIFCHFREEINEIADRLRAGGMTKVATFDGRTNNRKRAAILTDKFEALIMQIQTGCEGLNLQDNYSEIYFVSPHWNPAIEEQAIARCHRIGQTKPVFVERFEMCKFAEQDSRTIDNYVGQVQIFKRTIADECIKVN